MTAALKLDFSEYHLSVIRVLDKADQVILGKRPQLKLSLCCLLAQGHLLIEDIPGVGKTTLVRLLAKSLGLQSTRIQFTNDLLPADILGTTVFDPERRAFHFHKGPIFGQMVIADELNRATPKTQSACLQAMEERRVTVDGVTYTLPEPFFVVATQNPLEQAGTYPLPESQLDRFLMRIEIGYPNEGAEKQLLKGEKRDRLIETMEPILNPEDIVKIQKVVDDIHCSDAIVDYIQRVLHHTRTQSAEQWGLSPRAGLALLKAAKAWAFIEGRSMVLPEDVQEVGVSVIAHRLNRGEGFRGGVANQKALEVFQSVQVD
ncbi:MAG: AAA family ATPase [Bdellovibrionales bacterium]|nr:AAA family ATPase [Bdellovibrionales bacterium]